MLDQLVPGVTFFAALFAVAFSSSNLCGYQSCPPIKDGPVVNLHIVPHSHNDVGWVRTVDEYYYGNDVYSGGEGVKTILDSVVKVLLNDTQKRFIYVETAFFWKWWKDLSETKRNNVKNLVNNGRLEFVGGAWTMNDEATTYYQDIIDQFTWGFRKLEDTFGRCGRPRVGWQIDPFGHSRENAAIMAGLGFDGLFLGRIDWEDKKLRKKQKNMEMIWHTYNTTGDDEKLFTGILYNQYSSPHGFCFDVYCSDDPIVDDPNDPSYNIEQRAHEFIKLMKEYSESYRTRHILVTMGDDFTYKKADMNYESMDKLIKYINSNITTHHAFYSTPSCYLKAVNSENISFPTKDDDFFPYSSDTHTFWTGYFSSRPTLKRFERIGNNYLQVCKQLHSLSGLLTTDTSNLDALREAVGVMQHHDAISGTEKEYVAHDYARILSSAINQCHQISKVAIKKLFGSSDLPQVASCLLLNITSCPQTETSDMFVLTLYNPLSRPVHHLVRVPITGLHSSYAVIDPNGKKVSVQLVPIPDPVARIPGRDSTATAELVFLARDVPPLGFTSYHITRTQNSPSPGQLTEEFSITRESVTLGYGKTRVNLDRFGQLKGVTLNGTSISLKQSFGYYLPVDSQTDEPSSGAYIFRPNSFKPIHEIPKIKIFKGPLVTEVHQQFTKWISQVFRMKNDASSVIEFEWLVGPIPLAEDEIGREVVVRFSSSDIGNDGKFRTDSNGRSQVERKRNHRDSWSVHLQEPVAGNYYPVVSDISIEDQEDPARRLTLITDRSQGGSSLKDGTLELMVHRRLTRDDNLGVNEALDEAAFDVGLVARGKHWLSGDPEVQVRLQAQQYSFHSPWLFVIPTHLSFPEWAATNNMQHNGLAVDLPKEVNILTLEPWANGKHLLRLENISPFSPVHLEINIVFAGFSVEDVQEMSLDGNVEKSSISRLVWKEETDSGEEDQLSHSLNDNDTNKNTANDNNLDTNKIILQPNQIRTFIVRLVPRLIESSRTSK